MHCTINTSVCVCSTHPVTGDLMLIVVDQKGRALEEPAAYILKPTGSVFNIHYLRQLTKPHLSIKHMNHCNISPFFKFYITKYIF